MNLARFVRIIHFCFLFLLVNVLRSQVIGAIKMKSILSVRFTNETEDRHNEEKSAKGEQSDHQDGLGFVWNSRCDRHELENLVGQSFNSFFEPQDWEDNVGEVRHLLDVSNLTNRQIDLHTSSSAQCCPH